MVTHTHTIILTQTHKQYTHTNTHTITHTQHTQNTHNTCKIQTLSCTKNSVANEKTPNAEVKDAFL